MANSSPSPALSCSVCQMFSYSSASFSDNDTCNKCSIFAVLEARLSECESRLRTMESELYASVASQHHVVNAGQHTVASVASASCPPADPEQPGEWVTVRGKRSVRSRPGSAHDDGRSKPERLRLSNSFSLLSDTPAEKPVLVIGSSILRYVKPAAPAATVGLPTVICAPGAGAGDIETHLKLLAKKNRKYSKIILHVGGNGRKSEITKMNVESLCAYAKTMSDSVVFSGPLPNLTNDEMYSRTSSFHRWLSGWCPANDVGYVNNWRAFWGKPGLIERDGIHPTWDGAALISKNLNEFIRHKP